MPKNRFPHVLMNQLQVATVALVLQFLASTAQGSLLVEAHRGNSSAAPENTIASIQAAVGFAHLSEMDVRVTKDGQLILMHDAGLHRTTNGRGAVKRKTLDELQSLDAGSWFSSSFAGEAIPTLEQAINAAMSVGIEPLIERKAGTAAMYHDQFMQMNLDESDFRVISFNRRFIGDLNDLNPDYQLGILGGGRMSQAKLDRLADLGADFVSWRHNSVTQSMVDLVHANGMDLHVWTVNHPVRMQQLIDLGVDGITTDYPERLHDLLTPANLIAASGKESFAMSPDSALTATAFMLQQPVSTIAVPESEPAMMLNLVFGFSLVMRLRTRRRDPRPWLLTAN